MNDLLVTLFAAVVATVVMPLGLYLLPFFGLFSPKDQARAFGSFLKGREEGALVPGIVFGVVLGILWGFVYAGIWSLFSDKSLGAYLLLGFLSGAFFGENLSLSASLVFADNHPVPRFQENAWRVALGTVVIHIVHGVVFALIAAAFALDYAFLPDLVQLM